MPTATITSTGGGMCRFNSNNKQQRWVGSTSSTTGGVPTNDNDTSSQQQRNNHHHRRFLSVEKEVTKKVDTMTMKVLYFDVRVLSRTPLPIVLYREHLLYHEQ